MQRLNRTCAHSGMWSFLQCLRRRNVQVIGVPQWVPSELRRHPGYTFFESMFDYTGGWIGSG